MAEADEKVRKEEEIARLAKEKEDNKQIAFTDRSIYQSQKIPLLKT